MKGGVELTYSAWYIHMVADVTQAGRDLLVTQSVIKIPLVPAACSPVTVCQISVTDTEGHVQVQTPTVCLDGLGTTVKNVMATILGWIAPRSVIVLKKTVTENQVYASLGHVYHGGWIYIHHIPVKLNNPFEHQ
ncbi:hypothetical protein HOLleu_15367 [Holothuria leucospilota]|uniref:Uncharacterized protein n=1 Tax=Holothuria leucospilota TaxID=206669 RepID=A0A9Q1H9J8_HOLLE|nr:hypothetical protein HOLleu_15367 [Holothuria leucospilota]